MADNLCQIIFNLPSNDINQRQKAVVPFPDKETRHKVNKQFQRGNSHAYPRLNCHFSQE
jgi:hypothetical protein